MRNELLTELAKPFHPERITWKPGATTQKKDKAMALAKPFHPERITWKPGATTQKKDKAMALAYADPRAYMERLDEVCGMGWEVSYTPWDTRIICHVTINGITRSSTGESDSQSERSEIGGTASEAQAFKRACAMFGLGRYLYDFDSPWVEFDPERKQFTAQGKAKLDALVASHYKRAMGSAPEVKQPEPTAEKKTSDFDRIPNAQESDEALSELFNELGVELYGEQWSTVRERNISRITKEKPATLTMQQVQTLINGMNTIKAQRQPVAA